MAEFSIAVEALLKNEGGYSNDPDDHGGETKYGISQAAYPDLDIANLTLEAAKQIYRHDYWNGYGKLNSQAIANKMLDMAVNMGPKRANEILQRACGGAGNPTTVDGVFGANTAAAANSCDEMTLLDFVRLEAKSYYLRIVDANPSQAKFLNGWLRRASD